MSSFGTNAIDFGNRCWGHIQGYTKEFLEVTKETLSKKYLGMPKNVGRTRNGVLKYIKDRICKNVQG
jgi:sarcosine oxidase delta subunit